MCCLQRTSSYRSTRSASHDIQTRTPHNNQQRAASPEAFEVQQMQLNSEFSEKSGAKRRGKSLPPTFAANFRRRFQLNSNVEFCCCRTGWRRRCKMPELKLRCWHSRVQRVELWLHSSHFIVQWCCPLYRGICRYIYVYIRTWHLFYSALVPKRCVFLFSPRHERKNRKQAIAHLRGTRSRRRRLTPEA